MRVYFNSDECVWHQHRDNLKENNKGNLAGYKTMLRQMHFSKLASHTDNGNSRQQQLYEMNLITIYMDV